MQTYNDLHDTQAEASVISTILHHPEMILHSQSFLHPNMFFHQENGAIYWATEELYKKGIDNIDEINLTNQLKSNKAVSKMMTSKGLGDIHSFIEISIYAVRNSLPEYLDLCRTVCSYAYKREMYKFTQEIQRDCLDEKIDLKKLDVFTHNGFTKLTERFLISDEIRTIGESSDDILQELVDRQENDASYGIPSKFNIFEPFFQYERGELVVVKGRMKAGKSMFLLNECINVCLNNIPCLYIDSEIDDRNFYTRLLSALSKVKVRTIKSGHWTSDERRKINLAHGQIKKMKLYHYYMPVVNLDEVYALCKVLKYKVNLQMVFYDYIKAHDGDASVLSNKLGAITDTLKNTICGELELACCAACQLARNNMAAGSDQIDRYASTTLKLALKTPEEIQEAGGRRYGDIKVQVDLNRNGRMQSEDEWMSLSFDGDVCTITDCEQPIVNPLEEQNE